MLAFLLAILVGIAGLALFSTAFFFPGLYRKNDIIWGGVALFYALVLWICAQRITGAVLLGQTASVALTGWLGWQALMWRWSQLPTDERSTIADGSSWKQGLEKIKSTDWKSKLQSGSKKLKEQVSGSIEKATTATQSAVKDNRDAVEEAVTEVAETVEAEAPIDQAKEIAKDVQAKVANTVEQATDANKDSPAADSSPAQSPETPQKADTAKGAMGLGAVTGALGSLRDRLQGRKNHGKKYVRPADKAEAKTPETTSYEADWDEATYTEADSEEAQSSSTAAVTDSEAEQAAAKAQAEAKAEAKEEESAKAKAEAEAKAKAEEADRAKAEAEAKTREEDAAKAKAEAEAKAKEEAAAKAQAESEARAQAEEAEKAAEEQWETEAETPAETAASSSAETESETQPEADDSEETPEQSSGINDDSAPPEDPNWPPVDESENDSWVDGPAE